MTTDEKSSTIRHADVGIVGAGLAGLMAARQLVSAGASVCVLEARDRVGGRTWTRPASDGTLIDRGGQWIGPTQQRMQRLAAELGAETFKTWDAGNNVQYHAGERLVYSGAIPTADRLVAGDVMEAMLNLNMMAMQVPPDAPWTASDSAAWDAQTFATWLDANVTTPGARALLELAIQAVFSAEPRDLSL